MGLLFNSSYFCAGRCGAGQVVCGGGKGKQILVKYCGEGEALKLTVIAPDFGPRQLDGS